MSAFASSASTAGASLAARLNLSVPIIQAPMAVIAAPRLPAAVSEAGGLGFLALGNMNAGTAQAAIAELRALTARPFGVNVFCHAPAKADARREEAWLRYLAPEFQRQGVEPPAALEEIYTSYVVDRDMQALLLRERPAVVSFHFGLPDAAHIQALREAGILLMATATNLDEARRIEAAGIDAIVAQGNEAGGHRGFFDPSADDDELGTLALVRLLARKTRLPVVAAGGIMDGAGIAAVLAQGAQLAQLGTAFVCCPESAADAAYRENLLGHEQVATTHTLAISGRAARGIRNRLTALGEAADAPPAPDYPIAYDAGKSLHAAAKARGDSGYAAHWAGQAAALSRALPARELIAVLMAELKAAARGPAGASLMARLGLTTPVIQAPMAGTSTPALAAAVSNAGGLGFLGLGAMNAEAARTAIAQTRALTTRPFGVNVFCHAPARADADVEAAWLRYLAPEFARHGAQPPAALKEIYTSYVVDTDMQALLLREKPAVVGFHFGLPDAGHIEALRAAGILLMATATNLDEARRIEAAGIDVIVAQGIEAGGHRGMFDPAARDDKLGTLALVRLLVGQTRLPVVAAGGIMDGAGVAAVLALGAQLAQLGTAFVTCPESAADAAYRENLLGHEQVHTAHTRAISGRLARGVRNRLMALGEAADAPPLPDYPIVYDAGKALHAAAKAQGDNAYAAHWAGQAAALSRALPAAELVALLETERQAAMATLTRF